MNRKSALAKISRRMNMGADEALRLCNIPEAQVTKFTHKFSDEIEVQQIIDYLDIFNPICRNLLAHYHTKPFEFWERVELMKLTLPENNKLKELKTLVRKNWQKRPRTGTEKYLKKN